MADKANHAVLATAAFPTKTSQLCLQEGVIIANPARVAVVATMLRTSTIEVHRLRMSAEERQVKTAALYDFITSPAFTKYVERLEDISAKLGDIDTKEQKSHERVWQERGLQTRALTKITADLNLKINSILQS
jgi:hypothetical protein